MVYWRARYRAKSGAHGVVRVVSSNAVQAWRHIVGRVWQDHREFAIELLGIQEDGKALPTRDEGVLWYKEIEFTPAPEVAQK